MKLALLAIFTTLVAATPLPDAEGDPATHPRAEALGVRDATADATADEAHIPIPWHVSPRPGKCSLIYCIRAPCLQSCCREPHEGPS